jgi:hypothetical protein
VGTILQFSSQEKEQQQRRFAASEVLQGTKERMEIM